METLEEILQRIQKVTRNLHADMVVHQEEGHHNYFLSSDDALHRQYHIDAPEIRKPNIEWQEHAREELKNIYRTTPYITARIYVGRILLQESLSRFASVVLKTVKNRLDAFFDPHH